MKRVRGCSSRRSVANRQSGTSGDSFELAAGAGADLTQAREVLLNEGWSGINALTSRSAAPERSLGAAPRSETEVLDKLRNYLSLQADHLHSAERLCEGRSIGSGQVEGACQNLIGRLLKANADRWRVCRVNSMASLCRLVCSDR